MHILLDSLARLMAPLLPFTAEEIWDHMPDISNKATSVHLTMLPEANTKWKNEDLAQRWGKILDVRAEVTKALEEARAAKQIGHPLDATVTLSVKADDYDALQPYADDLRSIFIVSKVSLLKDEKIDDGYESEQVKGLFIRIGSAPGEKCERCWVHETTVGTDSEHPSICERCQKSLAKIQ